MPTTGFDPKKEFTAIRDQFNRVLGDTFGGSSTLALDIYDSGEAVVIVTQPLYGLLKDSLDIEIADAQLTVSGETVPPDDVEESQYIRRERKFGEFSRTVPLPGGLDDESATAQVKDHILTITIQKIPEASPRVVKVTAVE